MSGSVIYRALLFIALAVTAVILLVPTIVRPAPSWWPWKQPVRLGLDLQGGTHLLYHVDIDAAIDNTAERYREDLEREVREAQVGAFTLQRQGRQLLLKLGNADRGTQIQELVKEKFTTLKEASVPDAESGTLGFAIADKDVLRIHDNAVEQALRILRNRIDQFGVAEPTVQSQGADEIVVQLPGLQDPARAKLLIGRTAQLEFKLQSNGAPGVETQELDGKGERGTRQKYPVEKRTLMTGDVVVDASVAPGGAGEGFVVEFTLDERGRSVFGEITRKNIGRNLAIVLDGKVESAPRIETEIPEGRGIIRGRFEFSEAQDLANVLRNGALPAPLRLIEERTVGPSLGQDSIARGRLSFVIGGALVVVFMLYYYRWGGMIADLALVLNVTLLLAALIAIGATLTLPGIAGVVLTIGMAVDANVLIMERIREELRLGKSVAAAIKAGYDRAWYAIRDSNLTTFLSGLILYQFGTGPVRGFAITLMLGIATSVATGVFGTRVIYDILVSRRRMETVSI